MDHNLVFEKIGFVQDLSLANAALGEHYIGGSSQVMEPAKSWLKISHFGSAWCFGHQGITNNDNHVGVKSQTDVTSTDCLMSQHLLQARFARGVGSCRAGASRALSLPLSH